MLTTQRLLTVFTKHPAPGEVKTRLVPPLSAQDAARLALAMLDDALERFAREPDWALALAVSPAARAGWFRARYPAAWEIAAQAGDGLGARMARWFDERCAPGRAVVLIGSDVPLLGSAEVRAAFAVLATGADAVFAPDGRGGYSLVGLRGARPELFEDVPMSTDDVLECTLDRARSLGLAVRLLPACRDVDDEADLERLARDLNTLTSAGAIGPDFPRRTDRLLRALAVPMCRA
jgi:hypothetical protein